MLNSIWNLPEMPWMEPPAEILLSMPPQELSSCAPSGCLSQLLNLKSLSNFRKILLPCNTQKIEQLALAPKNDFESDSKGKIGPSRGYTGPRLAKANSELLGCHIQDPLHKILHPTLNFTPSHPPLTPPPRTVPYSWAWY